MASQQRSVGNQLLRKKRKIEAAYRKRSESDFLMFVEGLTIPSATGPQVFASCIASFQRECFNLLAPSLYAVQKDEMPPRRRFWIERTKKAGKDSDLSCCLLWLLAFAKRPLYIQVGAADRDQAGIIRRRMSDIVFYNPWLEDFVKVQTYKINSADGLASLDILAADVAGSHGETPDVLVINELSHVRKWEFVENLMDNASGVPQGLVVVATNAGFKGSKAEAWRKQAIESDDWTCLFWQQPAPWITDQDLKEAEKRNSDSRFRRLFWGRWSSGSGDALSEEDLERCLSACSGPEGGPRAGWTYLAGLDLGVSHDHAGMTVVGVDTGSRRIRVVQLRGWEPQAATGEVDLMEVEDTCLSVSREFGVSWFGYDPTEARLMAQRLRAKGVPMVEVNFGSPRNLNSMATALIQVVEGGMLECFEDEEGRLRRDLGKFSIVERACGYKLESVRDEFGHADVGTALVICLPKALSLLEGRERSLTPEDVIFDDNDELLTRDEVEEMPQELREIYDLAEEELTFARRRMARKQQEELI